MTQTKNPTRNQMATQAAPLNPSPKTRFQQSADNVSKHRALVDSNEFQRACDFALMQYQAELSSRPVDMQIAAGSFFKLTGAQEFLQTLRMLSEAPMIRPVVDQDNLKP